MTERYKAAAFIFYQYKFCASLKRSFLQVYLQYEYKHKAWSHFGGKREPYDRNSFDTAIRELQEEKYCSESLIQSLRQDKNKFEKKYFNSSKMMVYYVGYQAKDHRCDFNEADWFVVEALPNNVRPHIIEQINEISGLELQMRHQLH